MSLLDAAQRAKIRRVSAAKTKVGAEGDEAGELNVVPFLDIIVNVMMFVLATVAIAFTSSADVVPPRALPGRADKPLGLSILVVEDGFSIKARGGNVAPGCHDTGAGLAIARRSGAYDYAALQECVTHLKHEGIGADDTNVTISASPEIAYQALIATMDAVRQTGDGHALFPDVNLAVAR